MAKWVYNAKKKLAAADIQDPQPSTSTQANSIWKKAKKRAESKRVKHYLTVEKLKSQVASAGGLALKYKMRYLRLGQKNDSTSISPK